MQIATRRFVHQLPDDLPDWDGPTTIVLVFFPSELAVHPVLMELSKIYPRSHVLGCSTAGEVLGASVTDGSAVAAFVSFEQTRIESRTTTLGAEADSLAAGARLGQALTQAATQAQPLRAAFVLSEGLEVNGSELARGLNASMPGGVVVTGGLAADGDRFHRTHVLHAGACHPNVVTAIGLYGDAVEVRHGCRGGWDIFGVERVVTRAKRNIVFELDGRPILDLYKDYLGDRAAGLPATALLFPLELRGADVPSTRLVRTVLGIDEKERSMRFAGDVPEGARVQLMRANFDRLVQGAADAASATDLRDEPAPFLAIAVSCVGRRLVLGQRAEEETEATLESLGSHAVQVGFYSYGELSPVGVGSCELHNQTMTLTAILER